ncbi:unnamed protein product [Cuscuta epithymum]|uniref:Uncharacterized protein n=1 Tax=Cuscuta epithymum TaxID=186058 RepID=A0AAV0DIL4_9ASTE|nr:unnamed protein product [Cuscuta epithymum]
MSKLFPSDAIVVFTVLIGREKWKQVNICGSIKVSCGGYDEFDVFKKDENDVVKLLQGRKGLPILVGSGVFESCSSLDIICDLKDVTCCPPLEIKGYVKWSAEILNYS